VCARRAALTVFCLCLLAYGWFVYRGPHHNPDSRLALTYSLVERGRLDIDPYAQTTLDRASVGGHYYSDKAPGVSFLLAPLYAALRLALPADSVLIAGLPSPEGPDRFLLRYLLTFLGIGVPAAAGAAVLFFWLGRLEPRVEPRLAVAIGYALGSPAYPFAVAAFGHVPAGLCLFAAWALSHGWYVRALDPSKLGGAARHEPTGGYLARRQPSPRLRWALAGFLLAAAAAIEYPAAAAGAALVAILLRRERGRRRALGWLAAGAAPILAGLAGYHVAAFGAPWSVGYAHLAPGTEYVAGQAQGLLGLSWPRPHVALALLAGLHRGLLVHAPWLALALPGAWLLWRAGRRDEVLAAGAVLAVLLGINAGYYLWDGGASWGPRHLVPALPFLAVLALPAAARWPRLSWTLILGSVVLTVAAVATSTLPDSEVAIPLRDALWPAAFAGRVTNNWGELAGLSGWRGLVPALAAASLLIAWLVGARRAAGWLVPVLWTLLAAAVLNRSYLEYAEGYYLYLGARLAAGTRLYAQAASTQPPLLPMIIALLWRVQPDVYLPRLLALGCYLATALLAGRLARSLSPSPWATGLAATIAALLPLGAGAPQVLDANAALAPLAPAVALLWLRRQPAAAALAGLLAAAGLSIKLTFLPFAAAPFAGAALLALLRARLSPAPATTRGLLAWYLAALALAGGLELAAWLAWSGRAALDGFFGEAESPLLWPSALLAAIQLAQLEGLAWALAAGFWWHAWRQCRLSPVLEHQPDGRGQDGVDERRRTEDEGRKMKGGSRFALFARAAAPVVAGTPAAPARCSPSNTLRPSPFVFRHQDVAGVLGFGLAAATLPLFTAHQGTFAGVARPAEPFVAAFAAAALVELGLRAARAIPRRPVAAGWITLALAAATLVVPAERSLSTLLRPQAIDPARVLDWLAQPNDGASEPLLAPPYYAALAGRPLLFDYADWTVLGMRATADVPREAALAADLVRRLDAGSIRVAADFRLRYIPGVADALAQHYVAAGDDGDLPARSVTFFVPRASSVEEKSQTARASAGQTSRLSEGQRATSGSVASPAMARPAAAGQTVRRARSRLSNGTSSSTEFHS